jgi:hypothetical protein
MATMAPRRAASNFLDDVRNLIARVTQGEAFSRYLDGRKERIALLVALCVTLSIGCASGVILFVLGMRPILVLLAVLAVPFVLLGSLAILLYALFSWLENVALVAALHHGKPSVPQLPWPLVAAFVGVPFLLLLVRAPLIGIPLGAMAAAAPFLYLRFERRKR